MKLTKISIYNLRSIQALEDTSLTSGLDVFIGQNDSGKSTILYALDFFFNDKICQFQDDVNNKNDHSFHALQHIILGDMTIEKDEIAILCRFQLSDADLAQERSTLAGSSNGGVVSILKKCCLESRFDPHSGRGAKKAFSYFLLKDSFENQDFNQLSGKKEKDLIDLMDKYQGSKDYLVNLNNVGKPENIERVDALLSYAAKFEVSTAKFEKVSFDVFKDPIWPEFTLIDTKTSLDGKHKVIEDAFKKIDNKIERKYKDSIDSIKFDAKTEYDVITKKIKDYAKKNYVPLVEEFSARPSVKLTMGRDLVMKRVGQKEATHFDLQGDGTKRRMMVAILQASATVIKEIESSTNVGDEVVSDYSPLKIWAFDEPELHLHPSAQRDLFNSFNKFKTEGFQIICSTHSTIFVNNSQMESVHVVSLNSDLLTVTEVKEKGIEKIIKQSLGIRNSDIFFSNLFIVVEGQTEYAAFPLIFENQFGQDISAAGISVIDGEGWDTAKDKVEFLFSSLGDAVCLFDRDVEAAIGRELSDFINDKKIFFIGTADFEDSFANEVWLKILTNDYNLATSTGDSIWTEAVLNDLRKSISATEKDSNKKFFKLLLNHYKKNVYELGVEGNGHPFNFDKKEIGQKLAESAIEMGMIPKEILDFINEIRKRL